MIIKNKLIKLLGGYTSDERGQIIKQMDQHCHKKINIKL